MTSWTDEWRNQRASRGQPHLPLLRKHWRDARENRVRRGESSASSLAYRIDLVPQGIYIGYRHYDRSSIAPLFPFGFGLSYTTFAFSDLVVSTVALDATFSVTFAIKNTGDVAGQEVAQVYISAPVEGRITSPLKELKGFKKVSIAPGQTEVVKIALGKSAFSYWDERRDSWVAPAGTYGVLVGSSSDSLMLVGEAVLEKAIMWRGL